MKYFLGIVAALLLTSCTGQEKSVAKKLRIGFVLATMNEERYTKDKDYFTKAATAQGAEVEFAACDNKVDLQTAKVEALLAKKIDVLVMQPVNGETAASIVKLAKKENISVVAYDRLIKNADIDLYVTQDSFKVGVLQAEAAVKATHGKGNYILLMGEAGHSVADEITRGVLSVLEKNPQVKVIVKQNHPGWSTSLALATTENALTRYKNDIQAILANNDGMAMGAVKALSEQKLAGRVFVAGADADLSAIKAIVRGEQSLTILKGIQPLAEAAVDAALKLAKKEPVKTEGMMANGLKDVPVLNTPVTPVTKENLDEVIIRSGFHPKLAIYGNDGRG